jgi:hypothetical protein
MHTPKNILVHRKKLPPVPILKEDFSEIPLGIHVGKIRFEIRRNSPSTPGGMLLSLPDFFFKILADRLQLARARWKKHFSFSFCPRAFAANFSR